MADRFIKQTVALAAIEATRYTDAAPTGADNALQIFDMKITYLDAQDIEIPYVAAWLGSVEVIKGSAPIKAQLSVSLAGSGTAATAPAWGALLLACAMAETTGLTTPNRVEYLTATDTLKSATMYWYDSGALHKGLGVIGNAQFSCKGGEAPKITFDFLGIDAGITAATNATATLTAWRPPVAVTQATVTDITLGATYSAGAISGGTQYNSSGLTIDLGNQLGFAALLKTEKTVLKDRKVTGTTSLELTAAQEVSFAAGINARTTQSVAFTVGASTGNKIMLFMPKVQFSKPQKEEYEGLRMIGYSLHAKPTSGNDELRIVHL